MFQNQSTGIVIAAIVALVAFALAGLLLIPTGSESTYRLGLLFGIIGTAVAAFVGMLKAGQAASNTNGKLDARIEAGVHRAMAARRRGDEPATPAEIDGEYHA
jgi:predicted cobalt transporter CbtA